MEALSLSTRLLAEDPNYGASGDLVYAFVADNGFIVESGSEAGTVTLTAPNVAKVAWTLTVRVDVFRGMGKGQTQTVDVNTGANA